MKFFKLFENLPFSKLLDWKVIGKLPSKEFLLSEFYNRSKHPYKGSAKFWTDDKQKLFDIESEIIRELIDNYPKHVFEEIETIKDFTLDCIIPEVLYKVRGKADIGFVHIREGTVDFYYTNTYLKRRSLCPAQEERKYDRIQLKKIVLDLLK